MVIHRDLICLSYYSDFAQESRQSLLVEGNISVATVTIIGVESKK
jgi:hypothetical protein